MIEEKNSNASNEKKGIRTRSIRKRGREGGRDRNGME